MKLQEPAKTLTRKEKERERERENPKDFSRGEAQPPEVLSDGASGEARRIESGGRVPKSRK